MLSSGKSTEQVLQTHFTIDVRQLAAGSRLPIGLASVVVHVHLPAALSGITLLLPDHRV